MPGDDVDSSRVALVGFTGSLAVFLLIVAAQALYYRLEHAEIEAKLGAQAAPQLRQLEAEQYGQLHTYRWADAQKKAVAIPIERAIELLAQESQKEGGL